MGLNKQTKMYRKFLIIAVFVFYSLGIKAQGIEFVNTTFEEALEKATVENKLVFIDVYADWCAPCKIMDREVFSKKEVGDFYNNRFVAYKLDADNKDNKNTVEKYKIQGLPTLLILNGKGELVGSHVGAIDPYGFIRMGKRITGELKTPDQLYSEYRKDKKNTEKMKAILLDAPYFIQEVKSMSQQKKWGYRVTNVFNKYVEEKGLDNMINLDDFRILSTFHVQMDDENDKIVNFMVKYYNDFAEVVPNQVLSNYISRLHLEQILKIAKDGDEKYKRETSRIMGDMNNVYMPLYPDVEGFYNTYLHYADAIYFIFHKKDVHSYITSMEKYLEYLPSLTYNDYALAIENLINGLNEKLDETSATKSIEWIEKALEKEHNDESTISMKTVLGDCLMALGKKTEAKKAYDEAYRLLLKSQNQNFVYQMQQILKQKLSSYNK